MAKEEGTPERAKRTTRSSSLTTSPRTSLETQKTDESHLPCTSPDLLFMEEPISLDNLLSSFLGRRTQMLEILQLIGPLNSPMIPLFVYGGVSTGKTGVVLQIFRHLNCPFIYASCRSCYSPRILFESILNQLFHHRRISSNGYSSAKRCGRASDFINLLKDALTQVIDGTNEHSKKSSIKQSANPGNGKMIYLIFDNVELIRLWDENSSMISLLFKLHDILKMPEVGLIYISSTTPNMYYSTTGSSEPIPVFFPDYTEDDLYHIFMKNQVNPRLYSSFLRVVLKLFYRITRRVDELSIALQPLFKKYCEPLSDLRLIPDEAMNRRLFDNLQPYIAPSLDEIFKVYPRSSLEANKEKICSKKRNTRKLSVGEASDELDFHMSVSTKYLLISAFLASRNPATLDAAMFDSTGGSSNQKRKRKSSETSIQQKDNKAQEMLMKGPGTFSLERLLAIFQCITSVAEGTLEEGQLGNLLVLQDEGTGVTSDVLLQLSTLCNANFISKGGSCPLEGSTRYRSTMDEETALKVARSINFPLSKYLYRR